MKNLREEKSPEGFYKHWKVSKEYFTVRANVREQYTSGSNKTILSSGLVEREVLENDNFTDRNPVIPSIG